MARKATTRSAAGKRGKAPDRPGKVPATGARAGRLRSGNPGNKGGGRQSNRAAELLKESADIGAEYIHRRLTTLVDNQRDSRNKTIEVRMLVDPALKHTQPLSVKLHADELLAALLGISIEDLPE